MDVPDSLYFMLDIIKEMIFTVEKEGKKVLVHCHAGKGRTGIVIACYLIYKYHICAQDAAAKVREKRKGAIENKDQLEYCKRFFQCKILFFFLIFLLFFHTFFYFLRGFYLFFLFYFI
jgi:protein tyrosine phosphatase domain-containing protein 1